MAKAGRKRKEGRRDAKGKLRPLSFRDPGNDKAAAKRDAFGTDGSDAIGRAYRSGLLGDDGQRLMQTARSIHRAYWPIFGVGAVGCTLGDRVGGGDGEGNIDREKWLTKTMLRIDAMGRAHRKAFDELVLDFHPDFGPMWLDRIILRQRGAEEHCAKMANDPQPGGATSEEWLDWERRFRVEEPGDLATLELAVKVLEELAG